MSPAGPGDRGIGHGGNVRRTSDKIAADHPSLVIYRKLCAECHGNTGQGVPDQYDEPLHGNRTVEALAKRMARTMPEDNVGACGIR